MAITTPIETEIPHEMGDRAGKLNGCHHFLVSHQLGGASRLALGLARGQADAGVPSRVWIPGVGPAADAASELGLCWSKFPLRGMQTRRMTHAVAQLTTALRLGRRPSIAHFHTPLLYGLFRRALRLTKTRSIVHIHARPERSGMAWAFRSPPNLIITCAQFMVPLIREYLGERGEETRIQAIPNAIDTSRFTAVNRSVAKQQFDTSPDLPVLMVIGNLCPNKGQETALRTVAELQANGRRVECWLVGEERDVDQKYLPELKQLANQLGIRKSIRFLGFRHDIPELLNAADFLLLPSHTEGLPLSILEAQASKLAVIASPVGGIPEIVEDGSTGFLVDAEDPAGYAERIEMLLRESTVYEAVVDRAYQRVLREHSWDVFCARVQAAYDEVLSDG